MRASNKKAIVLLSGGLDSTTALAYAKNQGFDIYALSFNYGQRHHKELEAAQAIASSYNCIEHKIVTIDFLKEIGHSALTENSIDVPNFKPDSDQIPLTYVPARNTIFLSIALGWAETLEVNDIFIGTSSIDYSGYPDCRPEYIKAFENMANLALKRTTTTKQKLNIQTPLIHLSKAETIQLGHSLDVDYSKTISCYKFDDKACGQCDSCHYRALGFKNAGVNDPTQYVVTPELN